MVRSQQRECAGLQRLRTIWGRCTGSSMGERMSWDKKMLWIVIAAREEAQARPGSRRVEYSIILSVLSQTPKLPPYLNPIISLLLFFLLWYAFVFDGLTFTLMVGSAEKGARTFSLRECAPQDCPCPFPRDVGGWAVVWGFKCSHFIFISLQLNHYLSRHCADEIGLVNASRVEPWQDRLVTT